MKSVCIFLLSGCAALAVSCVDKVKSDINRNVDIAALEPMTAYEVPVKGASRPWFRSAANNWPQPAAR